MLEVSAPAWGAAFAQLQHKRAGLSGCAVSVPAWGAALAQLTMRESANEELVSVPAWGAAFAQGRGSVPYLAGISSHKMAHSTYGVSARPRESAKLTQKRCATRCGPLDERMPLSSIWRAGHFTEF